MEEPSLPPKLSKSYQQEFERWFLAELRKWARQGLASGQEHAWRVVIGYLKEYGNVFADLTEHKQLQLKSAIFTSGMQTSQLVGVLVDSCTEDTLRSWGWSRKEVRDFPGWAYRIALIKALTESGHSKDFQELLRVAQSHLLSDAERQAVESARRIGLRNLKPAYDAAGTLVEGEALEDEKERLRPLLIEALIQRKNPLKLAREMFCTDTEKGIYRDFELVATTEMANCFHHGSFTADRIAGKFADNDLVFRIPRPQSCKLCISLYIRSGGTPSLYKVKDLLEEATPLIRVSGRGTKPYRALIGVNHPNCLCSSWQKYLGEGSDQMFKQFAPQYIEARLRYRIEPT